jgi:hypothetical protein
MAIYQTCINVHRVMPCMWHIYTHMGSRYLLSGASLFPGCDYFIFIRRITTGAEFWRLGRFLPFSYRLEVLGVVVPYHYD